MNYYQHHIGDYAAATVHLSLLEHGVYIRLMQIYYTREEPIPADQAARLVGARSEEEREAVRVVLAEFFTRDGDSYRHKRCDEEIARYQQRAEINREVGKKGGRPRKNPDGLRTEPTENPDGSEKKPKRNPNQEPLTINQEDSVAKATGDQSPAETIFALGVPMLTSAGVAERNARSFLGLLRKHNPDGDVIAALQRAGEARAVAPIEFLQGCLRVTSQKPKESPYERSRRELADKWMGSALSSSNVIEMEAVSVGKPKLGR